MKMSVIFGNGFRGFFVLLLFLLMLFMNVVLYLNFFIIIMDILMMDNLSVLNDF